jgi:cytochrome c oxidase assembly protein subunit 15
MGAPAPDKPLIRRLAFASLVANIGIVLTGGAVRLTGSGLGCPTWPRCTDDSWTATSEMGMHGLIEYGNRTLTGVLGVIALAGLVAALARRPRRRSLVWLATGVLAGIAAQGVVGGIVVWTDLNPSLVGGHFLVSMALIATAYAFWRQARRLPAPEGWTTPQESGPGQGGRHARRLPAAEGRTSPPASGPGRGTDGNPYPTGVPAPLRTLAWVIVAVTAALLTVGTVVTGSGPHAGDAAVPRNGLDPERVAQVHADLAFLLLGLTVAGWFALRAVGAPRPVARASGWLVAAILGQGGIGLVQYFTGLPELVVWLHLLGSCLVWLAAIHLFDVTRVRVPSIPSLPTQTALSVSGAGTGAAGRTGTATGGR